MDIRHYFEPVDFSIYNKGENPYSVSKSLGKAIEKSTMSLNVSNFKKLRIAIFSVPDYFSDNETEDKQSTNSIRKALYALSEIKENFHIADFGSLRPSKSRKGLYLALRDIVDYLKEAGIITLIINGKQDICIGICRAFAEDPFFTFSTIDPFLDIKKGKEINNSGNYLSQLFAENPNIFQFSLIAFQKYYVSDELFSKTKGVAIHQRLGIIRENPIKAEPILRNTNVLSFDIKAIKHTESPGSKTFFPNGLNSDEACQLAFYAGLSQNLKVFGLSEVNCSDDVYGITAKLSAQIIWYFCEGVLNRPEVMTFPSVNHLTFSVAIKNLDKPIVFYNDKITNQWWMEITSVMGDKIVRACSESEYKCASNDEIPELWLKYVQKLDKT